MNLKNWHEFLFSGQRIASYFDTGDNCCNPEIFRIAPTLISFLHRIFHNLELLQSV